MYVLKLFVRRFAQKAVKKPIYQFEQSNQLKLLSNNGIEYYLYKKNNIQLILVGWD